MSLVPTHSPDLFRCFEAAFGGDPQWLKQPSGDHKINPLFESELEKKEFRPAAVLVALFDEGPEKPAKVLLTQRSAQLSSHSGQVAFPGGKIDEGESPLEAAIREAEEEVGLLGNQFSVIGELGPYFSGSGFKISPVLVRVSGQPELTLNPGEVESAFQVPASHLFSPNSYQLDSRVWQNVERFYYSMNFRDEQVQPPVDRRIWGVTAGIIRMIHDRIFAGSGM